MLSRLKEHWRELTKGQPGRRFEQRFEKNRDEGGGRSRMLKLVIGFVLIAVGVVFLVIPGPGSVLIVIGAALLAEESKVVARFMDRAEMWGRQQVSRFTKR